MGEMSWLTCQDFKRKLHLCPNYLFDNGQKVRFGVNSYFASDNNPKNNVHWLLMCIIISLVIIIRS